MILGLEELKFIFNPVTRLCYSEFEARLAGLMWSLKKISLKDFFYFDQKKGRFHHFQAGAADGRQTLLTFEGNIICAGINAPKMWF